MPKTSGGPVSLLTDFGLEDAYTGVMKGVILSINPAAKIVDITHCVKPQDIAGAQFILKNAVKYFPEGAVHVAVVDPGVGSGRRAIIVRAGGSHFVGPDNGIFTAFFPGAEKIVSMENEKFMLRSGKSSAAGFGGGTFDARDVFAPAAAWISRGEKMEKFGPWIKDPVKLPLPEPLVRGGRISGQVLHVDWFGNCITNIDAERLRKLWKQGSRIRVEVKGRKRAFILAGGLAPFYMSAWGKRAGAKARALVNSDGFLEIFVPGGSASRTLGIGAGALVKVC